MQTHIVMNGASAKIRRCARSEGDGGNREQQHGLETEDDGSTDGAFKPLPAIMPSSTRMSRSE